LQIEPQMADGFARSVPRGIRPTPRSTPERLHLSIVADSQPKVTRRYPNPSDAAIATSPAGLSRRQSPRNDAASERIFQGVCR